MSDSLPVILQDPELVTLCLCFTGGPGSGKLTQSRKLLAKNPGWVHLSMGDLLKSEIANKGTAGAKWGMIGDLVSQGEMAPEVTTLNQCPHPKCALPPQNMNI